MMDLAEIFGPESEGETAEERAATSVRMFVRSQMQLALDSDGATGRRLTASEALESFGLQLLERVVEDGGAGIITDPREPARTLSERRRRMRLSKRALAAEADVSVDEVTSAETPGSVVPIRQLERIAQALALDERLLGIANAGKGDGDLVTRLRELRQSDERDEIFVARLSEAAWVIARQSELSGKLRADRNQRTLFQTKSGDYADPAWKKGYDLAERTRKILDLSPTDPIQSIYAVAQDRLGIPIVDMKLDEDVAGATVLNGPARGIVLNMVGANRNILVRRMTIAHELGHLLWDPDHQLERVRVDESSDLGRRDIRDSVEARANAFAVAFLAPRTAVKVIYDKADDVAGAVTRLVDEYGIGPAAAANHLANVCNLDAKTVSRSRSVSAAALRLWDERENQVNLISGHVPASRGARFALLTMQAVRKKLISIDTAASWLKIEKRYLADLF